MKQIIFLFSLVMNWHLCYAQIDSVSNNLQDFNYLTAYTEANYAAYPSIISHGYATDYQKLKNNIQDSLTCGAWGIKEATSEYAYWFNHNFDAHYIADLFYFWKICKRRDTPDYAHLMLYDPKAVSLCVNRNTWLIRIPSCGGKNPTNEWVAESVKSFLSSKCKNLILDIRGNRGGSDAIWEPLVPIMIDHQAKSPEKLLFRNTYHNRLRPSIPDWMNEILKGIKDDKPFVVWSDDDEEDEIPKHDANIHIAIIIDKKTASSAETILRTARNYTNSDRVTIYGKENSAGCAETGNVLPFHLPHSRIQVFYPCVVSSSFLQQDNKYSTPGIAPDVIIKLPYPDKLTDNIDSWVLWVAKDIRRKDK